MKCCVVIPVGPGHQALAQRVINSVEQAIKHSTGPFTDVEILPQDDSQGLGRSRARNIGTRQAAERGADWLFFIDADELMAPQAFALAADYTEEQDAIWGAIFEADITTHEIKRREREISPITTLDQVLLNSPFLTLHNGHFVRLEAALAEPFNEDMDCGEDFEYYLRIWAGYRCIKLDQPLFYNIRGQHSTGPRAATGRDWNLAMPKVFTDFCTRHEVVANVPFAGTEVKFRLSNTLDLIQNQLARERFFEIGELTETLLVIPKQARVFDVGTNIGNHALFFSAIGGAAHVQCFEPADITADLLATNFTLNAVAPERYGIERIGVGARPGKAAYDRLDPSNLGATSLKQDDAGTLEIDSLDHRFPEAAVDLLKIDVEGMEMDVLAGAATLITRNRPIILIEVANAGKGTFLAWVAQHDYRVHRAFELVNASNYLLVPRKWREGFYDAGIAATRDWVSRVRLAPEQAPCGWSIKDFFEGYLQRRRTVELLARSEQLVGLELGTNKQQGLGNGAAEFGRKYPGSIALLGEILAAVDDGRLGQILDGLAKSTQEIILFDLMDARWDKAFKLTARYRDAEYYITALNRRGYRLQSYQKLPHKAALGAGEQLDSRITLLHFKKG